MFENRNFEQQSYNAKPLIETMIETTAIANIERNKAVREVVGGWIRKLRKIRKNSVIFGGMANA